METARIECCSGQPTDFVVSYPGDNERFDCCDTRLAELNERNMEDELPELLTLSLRLRKANCRALSSEAPNMLE
jgi:hypothetical protein